MSNRLRHDSDNRDTILAYVETGGDDSLVVLNETQKTMLKRCRAADELIRMGGVFDLRENVAKRIMFEFGVSRDTAYKDIVSAEHVFYSSAPMNKKYFIHRKIESLQREINEIKKTFFDTDGKYCFDEDKHNIVAKYEMIIQKYMAEFPEVVPPRSPKNINYIINGNLMVNNTINVLQANVNFDNVLKRLEQNEDY
jgi:hypothetical protein